MQAAAPTDPLAVFRAALAALHAEDYRRAASLCDPVSLRAFKRQLVEQFAPSKPMPALTVEDLLRMSPEMPRAAAEYEVEQHRRHQERAKSVTSELPTVASVVALQAMPPADVFAAWLDGQSPRRMLEAASARDNIPMEAISKAIGPEGILQFVALGAVPDGDRVTHVVYRHTFDEKEPWTGEIGASIATLPADEQALVREQFERGHPRTAACRRQADGTWALIASHNFLGVGSMGAMSVGALTRYPGPDDGADAADQEPDLSP